MTGELIFWIFIGFGIFISLCSCLFLSYQRWKKERVKVGKDEVIYQKALKELEGKYLIDDKNGEQIGTPEQLMERQREALRHVVLQIFAFIPITVQILRYPEVSFKAGQRYFWVTPDEKKLGTLSGPRGKMPLGAAIDFNGDVSVAERGEGTVIRKVAYEDVQMQDVIPKTPDPPTRMEAYSNSITIKWIKPIGLVDSYDVQFKPVGNRGGIAGHWRSLSTGIINTQLTINDLPCATSFLFRIRAHNPKGWTSWSLLSNPIETLPLPPSKPEELRVVSVGFDYIVIEWKVPNGNGSNINSYAVDIKDEIQNEFKHTYLGPNINYVACNLKPDLIYYFRVCASNHAGTGDFSDILEVKTKHPVLFQFPSDIESGNEEIPIRTCGDWEEYFDNINNVCYYRNIKTQDKQWEKPVEMKNNILSSEDAESTFRKKRFNLMRMLKSSRKDSSSSPTNRKFFSLQVRREFILEDSMNIMNGMSFEDLKMKMKVTFIGEEGMDAGGLTKDWYLEVSKQIFDPKYLLFKKCGGDQLRGTFEFETSQSYLEDKNYTQAFSFLGKFLAKAILDMQHVDVRFNPIIYNHILGQQISLELMKGIDQVLYSSLNWILNNDIKDVIFETFSVTSIDIGSIKTVDLIENGSNLEVTNENKQDYVKLMLQYRTAKSHEKQLSAFLSSFYELIPYDLISVFTQPELEILLNGKSDIDVGELRSHVNYTGGYTSSSPIIIWFWNGMKDFSPEQRGAVLRFITGSHKIPLDGLDPILQIMKDDADVTYLPRSHTCFNQLVLPNYPSPSMLIDKLLLAVNNAVGFQFS